MKNKTSVWFLVLAILALLMGSAFGLFSVLQYLLPTFLKEIIPFNQMRELHVSLVVSWVILAATGGVYYYINQSVKLYSFRLQKAHLLLFAVTGLGVFLSLISKKMGGREYMTYSPYFYFPIILGWLLFAVNFFKTANKKRKPWPVYMWMWATGISFMILTYTEAHLWVFSYFRSDVIRDLTVQWKSYGAMVGSWNMLVYGTAIYLMSKIKKDESVARGRLPFFFYFLGFTNLMFGWAHHTYIIPTSPWVRLIAYAISMTEWIILCHIIWSWSKTLKLSIKTENVTYRWLMAADFWVFANLILALLMSIPAINFFTHGTHVTVAHSMGTTIGINTTILLASLSFIATQKHSILLQRSFYLFNGSLLVFLSALIYAGYKRSIWMYADSSTPFGMMFQELIPAFIVLGIAGLGLFISLIFITIPLLKRLLSDS